MESKQSYINYCYQIGFHNRLPITTGPQLFLLLRNLFDAFACVIRNIVHGGDSL